MAASPSDAGAAAVRLPLTTERKTKRRDVASIRRLGNMAIKRMIRATDAKEVGVGEPR